MKALASFLAGVALCAASLHGTSTAQPPRCLYYAETPTGTEAYLGLEDAQQALQALGVDPANTPFGYDITSAPGC